MSQLIVSPFNKKQCRSYLNETRIQKNLGFLDVCEGLLVQIVDLIEPEAPGDFFDFREIGRLKNRKFSDSDFMSLRKDASLVESYTRLFGEPASRRRRQTTLISQKEPVDGSSKDTLEESPREGRIFETVEEVSN